MTSIVVSLYFKQENCETLISLYNWGRMKRCQSQLVSCKVEWFCSLVGFSRWPRPLFISPFLRPLTLFCRSRSALCTRFRLKSSEKGFTQEGLRWGSHYYSQLPTCYLLHALPARCPAATTVSVYLSAETNHAHSASTTVVVCLVCIQPKEKLMPLSFFVMLYQILHKQYSATQRL